jgi:uncharacterized protein YecE (DUF72 family)
MHLRENTMPNVELQKQVGATMQFFIGTSGYSYKEWKGSFYPKDLRADDMLAFYAQHFAAVEINGSFYRLPTADTVKAWTKQVPEQFQFVLKSPQTITHFKRLKEPKTTLKPFLQIAAHLKERRGPLYFQLPGNFKKDLPRLEAFLVALKKSGPVTFEFRHASWFDDETFALLRKHAVALCINDWEDSPFTDILPTADWGYLRLRRGNYTDKQLAAWLKKIREQPWTRACIFFMHEDTGTGPKFARRLLALRDA